MLQARSGVLLSWTLLGCVVGMNLGWVTQASAADDALGWQFEVGDEHKFRLTQATTTAMDLGPVGKMNARMHQTIDTVWKITAIDEAGAADLTHEVLRVQMQMQAPGELEMDYDSASADAPVGYGAMVAPTMKALIGLPFNMKMTARGAITSVDVPEKITQSLAGLPGAEFMGETITGDGLQIAIQRLSITLPKPENLVPGHRWTTTSETSSTQLGKVTTSMTYTYEGSRTVDGDILEVFKPNLEFRFNSGKDATAAETLVDDQKTRGEFIFNRSRGRLQSSSLEQYMTLQISAGDHPIKQEIVQKVSLERVEAGQPEGGGASDSGAKP
ncbi:MAG: DUF6263 family protein [Pirellulales bacterium]|nr:DUF6263 family protein [Pirellulales bacterium]